MNRKKIILKMGFRPKEAICNHLLMIMAIGAGGSHTMQRGYLPWSKIRPASPSALKLPWALLSLRISF